MQQPPEIIHRLVEKFDNDAGHYRGHTYNETQTRIDFINPMFKALGWDMDNTSGYADAYRVWTPTGTACRIYAFRHPSSWTYWEHRCPTILPQSQNLSEVSPSTLGS
jgi:hypothetical protein